MNHPRGKLDVIKTEKIVHALIAARDPEVLIRDSDEDSGQIRMLSYVVGGFKQFKSSKWNDFLLSIVIDSRPALVTRS